MDARFQFRAATSDDLSRLSAIAVASKAHWGYPAAWMESWRPLLTLGERDLKENRVELLEFDGEAVGFFALSRSQPMTELMHLWLEPQQIGRGAGRQMIDRVFKCARELGATTIELDADPYAVGFYEHVGARHIAKTPAPMPGDPERYLPRMLLSVER